ncbi:saccharopine dehydrogenase family protein [Nocardia amamiensis]|uniref:saccharopine dehydrogenase family protein n=1 Tax=Nocardia TaxID=1817 RepID=UPI0033DF3C00
MKIAVYGASGFQGGLVVAELARRGIETVLVGRDKDRLKNAAAQAGVPDAELQLAAIDDTEALVSAFRYSDAVINCAGPFTPHGDRVIRAAITAGCHYVDTAGEQLYMKRVYDTFMAEAEQAGVTVVPAVTDGGVPGDLLARLLAERLEGPIDLITSVHRITLGGGVGISRGSLRSFAHFGEDGGLAYEDGAWRADNFPIPAPIILPDESSATPVVRFPLQEVVTVPRHVQVRSVQGLMEEELSKAFGPVSSEFVESWPETPDETGLAEQSWRVVIDAVSEDGRRARGVAQGRDTYGTTALTVVEGAIRLADGKAPAGVRTPAQAFDPVSFLDSLVPHGTSWTIEI